MKRSTDRILTSHVGSLIRPPALIEFLRARREGRPVDEAAFAACLKDSVAEIVRRQAAAGVDVVSDGEFGKTISWSQYALERLSGFERRPIKAGVNPFARTAVTYDRMVPPASFDDYRRWVARHVEVLNHALDGIPEDRVRYHVCWGSWPGPHTTDVPLKDIVDLILKMRVGAYVIEGANPRHEHEWKVWQDVKLPPGKVLIPGVISHATNIVEHPELVCERIVRFAGLVGRENLIAGTDCGFAQSPMYRRVHPSIMWAKLEALAEGARLATKELWG
jgi:methionine synthase II (cobalamin-independent)